MHLPYIEIIKQVDVFWDKSNDKQDIENNGNIYYNENHN